MCADLEDSYPTAEYVLLGQFVDSQNASCRMSYPCGGTIDHPVPIGRQDFGQIPDEAVAVEDAANAGKIRPQGLLAKLALPCQTQSDYDYNHCYSFYANGCYNTCQFVEMGDIEDFM